jgi:threonine dehydrogenase-like Zn-dependent dehydrogenase
MIINLADLGPSDDFPFVGHVSRFNLVSLGHIARLDPFARHRIAIPEWKQLYAMHASADVRRFAMSRQHRQRRRAATDSERGEAAIERERELTGGFGVHSVLECVGSEQAILTAIGVTRPGGAIGRVGVPHYETIPRSLPAFYSNIRVGGGPAPVRAYIAELLPDIVQGRIEPGRVFDRVTDLDGVPDGYRAMNEREAIKVMIAL